MTLKKVFAILVSAAILMACCAVGFSASANTESAKIVLDGKEFTANVGDKFNYTLSLCAKEIIEDVQIYFEYDNKVIDALPYSDSADDCFDTRYAPNLLWPVTNINLDGKIKHNASSSDGFDFTQEKVLFTCNFVVLSAGTTNIDFTVEEMTILGGNSSYYTCSKQVITDGIDFAEDIAAEETPTTSTDATESTAATEAPTETIAPDAPEVTDATEVTGVTEATDATEVTGVTEATDAPEVTDTTETTDVTEATIATDATEATVATEGTEGVETTTVVGDFTEPSETIADDVTEPSKTTEATEATNSTESDTTDSIEDGTTASTEVTTSAEATTPTETTTEVTEPVADGILGDATLDGKVNIKDVTLIQKYAANILPLDDVQFVLADTNKDTKVNIKDATAIQKFIAGLIKEF